MIKHSHVLFILIVVAFYACDNKQSYDLKIMSYNIKHGEGIDTILDLSRAAKIIKSQAPDLCALQEIDNYCTRSNSVAQTDYLAQQSNLIGTFGKFMSYQGGEYGMATLAAKPPISTKVLELPDGLHEPRSAIVHEVEIAKGCTIIFVNVHFDWISGTEGENSRLGQATALLAYINTLNKAVIITGDFNCTPSSPTMKYFYKHGFEFVNKGSDNLSFQGQEKSEIDHVIFRSIDNVKIRSKNLILLQEPLVSDHRPLVSELEVDYFLY